MLHDEGVYVLHAVGTQLQQITIHKYHTKQIRDRSYIKTTGARRKKKVKKATLYP